MAGKASARDVGALTFFFKWIVTELFPGPVLPGTDEQTLRELLVKVWNDLLLKLQDRKLTPAELETVGFELRRVWEFAEAYKAQKQGRTFSEWIQNLVGLAKEAGVPVPLP